MRKLIIGVILGALGFFAYDKYQDSAAQQQRERAADRRVGQSAPVPATEMEYSSAPVKGRCDGRVHCSQMTSCEEAEWFLQNCPGMKMDGDGDGDPCERGPC
jgi:hypothetical protein